MRMDVDIVESGYYFILGIIICYIGQIFDCYLKNSKRQQLILAERKLYFKKLFAESQTMEEEKSRIEADLMKNIEEAKRENEEIEEQLDDEVDSEWSSSGGQDELDDLRDNVEELKTVEESISDQVEALPEEAAASIVASSGSSSAAGDDSNTEKLNAKIAQLEEDNMKLRQQIDNHKGDSMDASLSSKDIEFDPELLKFLNTHKEMSLEFLQQAHDMILEIKASDDMKDVDFNTYVRDLRKTRVEYASKLAELRVAKKAAEHKLEVAKKKYLEELRLFDESKMECLLKRSVRQDYLSKLKESNQVRDEMIKDLEEELTRLRSEIADWKSRYQAAEQQSSIYYKAYQDSLVKKERLDAERARAVRDVSATSSFVDNIPPPPPVKIPTVDEMFQS